MGLKEIGEQPNKINELLGYFVGNLIAEEKQGENANDLRKLHENGLH